MQTLCPVGAPKFVVGSSRSTGPSLSLKSQFPSLSSQNRGSVIRSSTNLPPFSINFECRWNRGGSAFSILEFIDLLLLLRILWSLPEAPSYSRTPFALFLSLASAPRVPSGYRSVMPRNQVQCPDISQTLCVCIHVMILVRMGDESMHSSIYKTEQVFFLCKSGKSCLEISQTNNDTSRKEQ